MSQCESPLDASVGHENHDKTMTYVPRSTHNPSISQQDHDSCNDDTHMEDATAEEEKKYAPRQSMSDRKDARAESKSATSQLSKSDQQVRTEKRVTWANRDDT